MSIVSPIMLVYLEFSVHWKVLLVILWSVRLRTMPRAKDNVVVTIMSYWTSFCPMQTSLVPTGRLSLSLLSSQGRKNDRHSSWPRELRLENLSLPFEEKTMKFCTTLKLFTIWEHTGIWMLSPSKHSIATI